MRGKKRGLRGMPANHCGRGVGGCAAKKFTEAVLVPHGLNFGTRAGSLTAEPEDLSEITPC